MSSSTYKQVAIVEMSDGSLRKQNVDGDVRRCDAVYLPIEGEEGKFQRATVVAIVGPPPVRRKTFGAGFVIVTMVSMALAIGAIGIYLASLFN